MAFVAKVLFRDDSKTVFFNRDCQFSLFPFGSIQNLLFEGKLRLELLSSQFRSFNKRLKTNTDASFETLLTFAAFKEIGSRSGGPYYKMYATVNKR